MHILNCWILYTDRPGHLAHVLGNARTQGPKLYKGQAHAHLVKLCIRICALEHGLKRGSRDTAAMPACAVCCWALPGRCHLRAAPASASGL